MPHVSPLSMSNRAARCLAEVAEVSATKGLKSTKKQPSHSTHLMPDKASLLKAKLCFIFIIWQLERNKRD